MNEDDPLEELSAAARKKPSRMPSRGAYPPPGAMRSSYYPGRPKKSSMLVPILIGVGILAVGVPVGIIVTMKAFEPVPEASRHVIIKDAPPEHQQGELFKNVPTQDPKKKKGPPPED